jgi:HEAT repeat protein
MLFHPALLLHSGQALLGRLLALVEEREAARDPRIATLLDEMRDPRADTAVRARDVLTKHGKSVVPLLIDRLGTPDPDTCRSAALVLGNIADPRALGPLCDTLRDQDATVRYRAAYALGRLKDPGAVAGLAPLLLDPSPDVVDVALRALEECGCKVRPRSSEPGYEILPRGEREWQVVAPREAMAGQDSGNQRGP